MSNQKFPNLHYNISPLYLIRELYHDGVGKKRIICSQRMNRKEVGETSTMIDFGNGIFLNDKEIERIADNVISAIKNELPEKAHCAAVVDYILEEAKAKVQRKQIIL